MSRVVVGVDAGGTRTRAVLVRDGVELARVEGGAGAVRPGRALVAATAILDAVRRVLAAGGLLEADVLVVGAAGVGREPVRLELERALRKERLAGTVSVTTDVAIAHAAAFGDAPGIILIAGTGSIALARDEEGRTHRAGGHGWQMGDDGGAYDVGRAALSAVGRAQDGRLGDTVLTSALPEAARVADVDGLVAWAGGASPGEVAALARAVLEAASAGDAVAGVIVQRAADELVGLAQALVHHYSGGQPVPVALAGGMLEREPLRGAVLERLSGGRFAPLPEAPDAVAGAVALATQASGDRDVRRPGGPESPG